jgi:hypothetical protein
VAALLAAATGALSSFYWLGLEKGGVNYWWPDATTAGTGAVSNANPYAHFSYNHQDILGSNPTWNCTYAHVSYQYDNFTGARCCRLCLPRRLCLHQLDG